MHAFSIHNRVLLDAWQVLRLMRLAPAGEEDRQAKAALYARYAELLPAALVAGPLHSLQLITELLNGIKIVIAANIVPHQNLFRWAYLLAASLQLADT